MSDDPYEAFVARHALTPDADDPWLWRGRVRDVPVRLEVVPEGPDARGVRVVFEVGHPGLVVVARALALGDAGRSPTGDALFDKDVVVRATDARDLGLFDAAMRVRLAPLVASGVHVRRGELVLEGWAGLPDDQAAATLDAMSEVAQAFAACSPSQATQAYARIARTDPDPKVRARFVAAAAAVPDLQSAVARAQASGVAAGDDASFDLLSGQVLAPALDQKVRYQALVKLLSLFPPSRVAPIVRAAAADRATRVMALRAFNRWLAARQPGEDTLAAGLELFARVVTGAQPPADLGRELATHLTPLAHPAALPGILHLCEHNDSQVVLAAIGALAALPLPPAEVIAALPPRVLQRTLMLAPAAPGLKRASELLAALYQALDGFEVPRGDAAEVRWEGSFDRIDVLRASYLDAFGELGEARWTPLVLPALADPDGAIQLAAIECLAAMGDVRALAPLRPLTGGFFRPARIKERAQAAIAAIRARTGGEDGALSLADGAEAGGLGLVDED